MVKAVRRLVLEQFGYIDVDLELDMGFTPSQVYEFALKIEKNLDAYKSAFWDLMKEKKESRLSREQEQVKEQEAQKVEDIKAKIAELIKSEPDAIQRKMDEFGGMIDSEAAALLILKAREQPAQQSTSAPVAQIAAPSFPLTSTFFESQYGWAMYTDVGSLDSILAWIVSIPKETRGRKTAEPKKATNGKSIYVNEKEMHLIIDEIKRQNKQHVVKRK